MNKRPVAIAKTRERPVTRLAALVALALAGALSAAVFASNGASAQEWQIQEIDQGTKPALSVTPDGDPVIIYMLERLDGWVRVASLVDGEWQTEEIATGYFYGPPDIAIAADGVVHATFHDHQAQNFQPDLGDAAYARREDGTWTVSVAADPGHDGWDNRITVDAEGNPHMVAVDPVEFNGSGVEYYSLDENGAWQTEAIGSGPQTYKYAVSVSIDSDGIPWVVYHDGADGTLKVAHPSADGWQIEVVDDGGDTGFFNESAFDANGGLHISYFDRTGDTTGVVRYAYRAQAGDEWQITAIDELTAVSTGFTGARNITSIDIDSNNIPVVVYSDESVMKLARLADGEWQSEIVTEARDLPLGQIVSLGLDADDRPHIAFSDVSDKGKLDGTVWYATKG